MADIFTLQGPDRQRAIDAVIRAAQQRAALAVNKEVLQLYWQIGRDVLDRQAEAGWGAGILGRIEADLRVEFPEMRGFSQTNLKYVRTFAEAWPDRNAIGQRSLTSCRGARTSRCSPS